MKSNYFTVEVKPTIGAIQQQVGVYTAGDLLFDWTSFDIPRGVCKLTGVTIITRPKGDTDPTPNPFGVDLLFGKVGTSIGTSNGTPLLNTPTEDILGSAKIATGDYIQNNIGSQPSSIAHISNLDIVLTPDPTSGANVGVDRFYIAGIATGAFFFTTTTNIVASDSAAAAVVVCDGTSADLEEHFLAGDIIQTGTAVSGIAAGTTLGTVKNLGDAAGDDKDTTLTLTAASNSLLKDGMLLYNTSPVKLVLHLEK